MIILALWFMVIICIFLLYLALLKPWELGRTSRYYTIVTIFIAALVLLTTIPFISLFTR